MANGLTLIAMAGLGLLADFRVVKQAGRSVMITASLSLAVIAGLGVLCIELLHL